MLTLKKAQKTPTIKSKMLVRYILLLVGVFYHQNSTTTQQRQEAELWRVERDPIRERETTHHTNVQTWDDANFQIHSTSISPYINIFTATPFIFHYFASSTFHTDANNHWHFRRHPPRPRRNCSTLRTIWRWRRRVRSIWRKRRNVVGKNGRCLRNVSLLDSNTKI